MEHVFHEASCIALLIALAERPGPSLGEASRRALLQQFFSGHDVPAMVDGAGNLRVLLGDGPWEDTVVFDAHLDVVQEGFEAKIKTEGGRLIGMGVADNLAAVSLLAHWAVASSHQYPPSHPPVLCLFSVGEEGDGNLKGVRHLVAEKKRPPRLFISFDLNFDHICHTALGSQRYRLTTRGPGGHSWSDHGLPSAIDTLMTLLHTIQGHFTEITAARSGEASINIGTISGGEGINSIAANASATFEFRSVDPALLTRLDHALHAALKNHPPEVTVTCTTTGERPAAKAVDRHRVAAIAMHAVQFATGTTPTEMPMSTNINLPLSHGWPSVCLGLCQGNRFHSHEEFLEIDSLAQGWQVLHTLTREIQKEV